MLLGDVFDLRAFFLHFFRLHLHIPLFSDVKMYIGGCRVEMHTPRLSQGIPLDLLHPIWGRGQRTYKQVLTWLGLSDEHSFKIERKHTFYLAKRLFLYFRLIWKSVLDICPFKNTLSELLNGKKKKKKDWYSVPTVIRITSNSGKMENKAHPPTHLKYINSSVVSSWI